MLRNSQCISGVSYAFPNAMSRLQKDGNYEDVFKLYEAVKELPNIKAYLASERRQVYGKGIYSEVEGVPVLPVGPAVNAQQRGVLLPGHIIQRLHDQAVDLVAV